METVLDRIKRRVSINDETGCWNWLGSCTADGYGRIKFDGLSQATHRVVYAFFHGAIPRGKVIRHQCDNASCCNPGHLVVGDHEDNSQDIRDRDRHKNRRRALTADEVARAVSMRRDGATKRAIAEALACNWYAVSYALDASRVDAPSKAGRPRGSRNRMVRVTDADKQAMRDLYATGQFTQQQLAERFSCDQTYVSLIVRSLK